jgi:putative transposase
VVKQTFRVKYRLYPTEREKITLGKIFGAVRWVTNEMLAFRSKAFNEFGLSVSGSDTKSLLAEVKKDPAHSWLNEIPSQPLQEATIHLDIAFQKFFKKTGGYPKFKSKFDVQSFQLPQPKLDGNKIFIPNFKKWIRFEQHRPLTGKLGAVTIIKTKTNKYFISFVVHQDVEKLSVKKSLPSVGVDLGIKDFAILSNGERIANHKFLARNLKKLRRIQRAHSRKAKGSANRSKSRIKLAKLHEKISNQRSDFIHKFSRKLIDENQIISIENLNVKGMVQNRKLSRAISNMGWGQLVNQLKYKSLWYGRSLRIIDRWFPSSKMCGSCGEINNALKLKDREWTCVGCGVTHDRDLNAAKNIELVGRDTPEFTPVERKTSVRRPKRTLNQVASTKQVSHTAS